MCIITDKNRWLCSLRKHDYNILKENYTVQFNEAKSSSEWSPEVCLFSKQRSAYDSKAFTLCELRYERSFINSIEI